jgi:hypothetical protein
VRGSAPFTKRPNFPETAGGRTENSMHIHVYIIMQTAELRGKMAKKKKMKIEKQELKKEKTP